MFEYVSWKDFTPVGSDVLYKKNGKGVCKDFISLDTETSHNHEQDKKKMIGWIYQWCFKYQDELVYGRRPSELIEALKKVKEVNSLCDEKTLIIFIHNASYDWAYIKQDLRAAFGGIEAENILAISNHNIISYKIGGFEFRCTFRLTLKSLDKWSREVGTHHKKLVGTVDYSVIRYQDTPLTKKDWKYMFADVIVLDEAIRKQMEIHNDTVLTLPYTTTGYVRREARKACNKKKGQFQFKRMAMDSDEYQLCRNEFAGGLTHGNRLMMNRTINGVIRHRDFVSHYPSQQVCYYAPCSAWRLHYKFETDGKFGMDMVELQALASKQCILAEIKLSNVKLRKGVTLPYLQTFKCNQGRIGNIKTIDDNGRIICLDGETVIAINELDLEWLIKQYTFNYQILRVYSAKRGHFPDWLVDLVKKFFYNKTEKKNILKEVEKSGVADYSDEYIEAFRNCQLSKGWLNGIYGMTATDPVRVSYFETEDGTWGSDNVTAEFIEDKLSEYYDNWNSFMTYQLGVWTTSNARAELMRFVELIGYENFLYADTDSIFYLSTDEIEKKIESENKRLKEECDKEGYYIDFGGKRHYFNQFELENEEITAFRFLHAKTYAYEVKGKNNTTELKVTIAGVKRVGRNNNNRAKELGSIENLTDGFVFHDCGGTQIVHTNASPATALINGHLTEYASSAIIVDTEKTLHTVLYRREHPIAGWSVDYTFN